MELLQLRYFLTVAKMLNISRAAKHHMIPQPAMSKTISKLEKELGKPLFDRYKNRLSLTEEGKAFYRSVSLSLHEIDNAAREMAGEGTDLSGEIKILVQQQRGNVVDCIVAFKKQHPGVSFQIFYGEETAGEGEFDLSISCEAPVEGMDRCECLITEKLKLFVCADHPLALHKSVPFTSLSGEEFAVVSRNSSLCQQLLLHSRQNGFEPKISMTSKDLYCLIKYVRSGMAVSLGSEIAWQDLLSDGIVMLPTEPEVSRSTFVYWNGNKTPSRLSRAFREFLVDFFAQIQKRYPL